jgi:hypothetical protein
VFNIAVKQIYLPFSTHLSSSPHKPNILVPSLIDCYAVGNIPITAWLIFSIAGEYRSLMKYDWIDYFSAILSIGGSHE